MRASLTDTAAPPAQPVMLVLLLIVLTCALCTAELVPGAALDPGARCEPLTSEVCASVFAPLSIGASIFVNSTVPQNDSISVVEAQLALVEPLTLIAPTCATLLRLFACIYILPPCATLDTQSTLGVVALPRFPCNKSCAEMQAACATVFANLGLTLPPCAPEQVYDFTAEGGGVVPGNCTAWSAADVTRGLICPVTYSVFGKAKPNRLRNAGTVVSYFSLVMCAAVGVLTAWNPALRKWPGGLIVFLATGETLLAFGVLMSSFGSLDDFVCDPSRFWRNMCKAQGFMLVAGLHVTIAAWLLLTVLTAVMVWTPNPAAALRASFKYRWYLPITAIVPIAFIAYCSRYLGPIGGNIVCLLIDANVNESGMVWPLTAEVAIGTLCWLASVVATIRAVGFRNASHTGSEWRIYVRLLVYEMLAILPAALYIVPWGVNRKNLISAASINSDFVTGGAFWRFVVLAFMAPTLAPFMFGIVFILRWDHYLFLQRKWQGLTTASGSRSEHTSPGNDVIDL